MTKKKTQPTPACDANLAAYRDAINGLVDSVLALDATKVNLYALDVAKSVVLLTETYGENLDTLEIPDGFLDALNPTARRMALIGISAALEATMDSHVQAMRKKA